MFGRLQSIDILIRTVLVGVVAVLSASVAGCGSKSNFNLLPASQNFGQVIKYNTQVDVLFVVDTSGSMGPKQDQLSKQFYPFIDYLSKSKFDFHLGVITMDLSGSGQQGHLVGSPSILTNSTPNLQSTFVNNINQGSTGSDLSRGLQSLETALSGDNLINANAGFLRDSALLAVIFLSDEDDGSVNSTQHYIDFLDKLKPAFPYGARGWLANSIVVPSLNNQCKTYNQFASPGLRYMDLSNGSQGVIESICSPDLVQATSDIKARITEMLTQYHLVRPADPASIMVVINGVNINNDPVNGWTFDIKANTITFHGSAVPPANAVVQVDYQPTQIVH